VNLSSFSFCSAQEYVISEARVYMFLSELS